MKLFAHIDEATPVDSIIASSSSGITPSVIQSACKHPERVIVGHPFNPPHIVPLVEVVGGTKTSPEAIQQAMRFYASIGKKPIHLRKELPGHVANRLQAALYREMLYLIEQDVLSVEEADTAVSYGPGLRWGVMGQSLQWHLGGGAGGIKHFMEQLMDPLAAMMKTLGNPQVTPELKQTIVDGVMREAGGRSGRRARAGRERGNNRTSSAASEWRERALGPAKKGNGVSTVFTAGASRLTETLESTLKSPASSPGFDLLANTNDVLSDVGLTAADSGGRLSFYGQDPIISSPHRFGAMAAIGLAAKSVAAAALWRARTGEGQDIHVDVRKALRRFCGFFEGQMGDDERTCSCDGRICGQPIPRTSALPQDTRWALRCRLGFLSSIEDGHAQVPKVHGQPRIHRECHIAMACRRFGGGRSRRRSRARDGANHRRVSQ